MGEQPSDIDPDTACRIEACERLLALPPDDAYYLDTPLARARILHALGNEWWSLYERGRSLTHLERASEAMEEALRLIPSSHPGLSQCIRALGRCLWTLSEHSGSEADLARVTGLWERALQSMPATHPDRREWLLGLGNCLLRLHDRTDKLADLARADQLLAEALELTPPGDPGRRMCLLSLSAGLESRYRRSGRMAELDRAIALGEEALSLSPAGEGDRSMLLQGLAASLSLRYERLGRTEDLDRAAELMEAAVRATSADDPGYALHAPVLGACLLRRHERSACMSDLNRAIELFEAAVAHTPPDHANRAMLLHNLASGLDTRYEVSGREDDLRRAIALREQALSSGAEATSDRVLLLHGLAGSYFAQYRAFLAQAERTTRMMEALGLMPDTSRDPAARKESLAQAIASADEALTRLPEGHPGRIGIAKSLDRSIGLLEESLGILPADHPLHAHVLNALGAGLISRYERCDRREDLERAYRSYRSACSLSHTASARVGLNAARAWLDHAASYGEWTAACEAGRHGVEAVRRLLAAQLSRRSKEHWLARAGDAFHLYSFALAREGVMHAQAAVLALEEGRAVLLTEGLRSREAVLDELARAEPRLVARYRSAAEQVTYFERLADQRETSAKSASLMADWESASRDLQESLDAVRRVKGYERFLTPPVWADIGAVLPTLPESGCLLYLAATAVGSLALIVCRNEDIEPVWLEFKPGDAERPASGADVSGLLSVLGDRLMGKVAEALLERRITEVTLIPCGALGALPLHAAYCEAGRHGAFHFMDRFTVRYAPNARSVGEAIVEKRRRAGNTMLLGLGNPLPVEQPLAFARCEMEEIERRFKRRYPAQAHQVFYERAARKDGIQDSLARCGCFHHAGHAEFDAADPLASKLVLGDGASLSLRELMYGDYRPKSARLVVLSACRSAETDAAGVPDEFLGLPAGFLQAGVPGVIGTFWPVNDLSTLLVMDRFYELHLAADMEPAVALQAAQRWLRDATCADLVEFYASHPAIDTARRETPGAGQRGAAAGGTFGAAPWYLPELQAPGLRPFRDRPEHWAGFVYVGV